MGLGGIVSKRVESRYRMARTGRHTDHQSILPELFRAAGREGRLDPYT